MSLLKLSRISLICVTSCLGMGYAFHKLFVKSMSENAIFLEALQAVKNHKGALYLLGEPIESKNPVLANKGMLLAGYSDVQVRVSGPKEKGIVFLKVTSGKDKKVKINSIQLQVGNDQSKRLVIRNLEEESNAPKIQEVKQ